MINLKLGKNVILTLPPQNKAKWLLETDFIIFLSESMFNNMNSIIYYRCIIIIILNHFTLTNHGTMHTV